MLPSVPRALMVPAPDDGARAHEDHAAARGARRTPRPSAGVPVQLLVDARAAAAAEEEALRARPGTDMPPKPPPSYPGGVPGVQPNPPLPPMP